MRAGALYRFAIVFVFAFCVSCSEATKTPGTRHPVGCCQGTRGSGGDILRP